jgi:hypothetical protein
MGKLFVEKELNVKAFDRKKEKDFVFDRFITKVNGIKVKIAVKGTAYDVLDQELTKGNKMEIFTRIETYEDSNTQEQKEYDYLYSIYKGPDYEVELPLKAADSFGRTLIINALK